MASNGLLEFQGTNKATFVGTNSNIVLDTVTSSLGIGVDVGGPTSNLHVVGNAYVSTDLTVAINTFHVDSTDGRVGVGTVSPDSSLHVKGDIIGRPISKTITVTKGTSLSSHVENFAFESDESRIVLNNTQGSVGSTRQYYANFITDVPTTIGTIIHLEINSSRTNTDSSGRGHKSEIQFSGVKVLSTGYHILGQGVSYNKTLKRTIILTSGGWEDFTQIKHGDDGNVGIGTTTPAIQLDVHGTNAKIGRALPGANIHEASKRDSVYIGRWDDDNLSTSFLGMRCRVDTHNALGYGSYSSQTEIGFYAWGNSIANSQQVFAINASGNGNMIGILTQSSTGTTSDDRIKYNEEDITSPLTLISQLNPQKYEKIVSVAVSEKEGIWIPTDEEWESVKSEYTYVDEFGFIAQDVRAVPELSFLVNGEETRTDTNTSTPEEYSNLTSEEQVTYTPSYVYESNTITQQEYSNLTHEEQGVCTTQYIKQIETQTPLSLNYNGLFVLAIGAIKELKAENDAIKARLDALENA